MLDRHMPDGHFVAMTDLAKYLDRAKIRQADFAAEIGVTQATVSRLAKGVSIPSLELAVRIERLTGGAVTAVSWFPEADVGPANSEDAA